MAIGGLFRELRRRNVWRASALYAGGVWALSQGLSQLTPALGLPDFATRWFLIAAALAFPVWVALSWYFALTPQGLKLESAVTADVATRHSTARKLDFAIIGVLAVAVALLGSGYFVRHARPARTALAFDPPAGTLVVLPFANIGEANGQQYFSDGITEELTNLLGRTTGLRVIAWDTASRYREQHRSATDVGRLLDVANVLIGRIQRQGSEVRVTVELVSARSGYQLWSNQYDDSLANVFQVQDRISAAIAGALKVKFASLGTARSVDPEAHDLALRARALMQSAGSAAPLERARGLFEQAIALAPGYADAHAGLARAWIELSQYVTSPLHDVLPRVRAEADRALTLDPRNVEAILALANADLAEGRMAAAKAGYERALQIDPSNADAYVDDGLVLPPAQGIVQEREAVRLDPDNATAQNDLATYELDLGNFQQALAPQQALVRLDPGSADNVLGLAQNYALLGRTRDAVNAFDLARPETDVGKALVAAGRLAYQSAIDPALRPQALAAATALRGRTDLDPTSNYDVMQLYLALGDKAAVLSMLPEFCASQPIGCSDLGVNPMYRSLHGEPRFDALVTRYDTVPLAATAPSTAPAAPASAVGGAR